MKALEIVIADVNFNLTVVEHEGKSGYPLDLFVKRLVSNRTSNWREYTKTLNSTAPNWVGLLLMGKGMK